MNQARQPAGTSTGGQFAATDRPEAAVDLAPSSCQPADTDVMRRAATAFNEVNRLTQDLIDAVEERNIVDEVLKDYPEATTITVTGYDDGNGPDAYLTIYDGDKEIGGQIAMFRPDALDSYDADGFGLDVAEVLGRDIDAERVKMNAALRDYLDEQQAAAAQTAGEASSGIGSAPEPSTYPGVHESTRVGWIQGHLANATSRDNGLSSPQFQAHNRQIDAEAYWLLTLPDDQPIPRVDEVAPYAKNRIEALPEAQRVPGRPGPLTPERSEQIADYFYERAEHAIKHAPAKDLTGGPTPTNAYVNQSLLVVARLRNPDKSRFAHDAERSALRAQMLEDLGR